VRIAAVVGTDHHPFDRLITWVNDWLGQHPEQIPAFFVQSGSASVEPVCDRANILAAGQLEKVLDEADVVICHGGPGSIADAWSRGLLPIVVPRLRRHGEVVDDHQVDFCVKLAGLGRIRLAQEPAAFADLLAEATCDPARFRASGPGADVDAAIGRFAALVDELAGRPPRRPQLFHRGRRTRRMPTTGVGAPADVSNPSPGPVPAASTNWHASSSPARVGLAEVANEEQE
jgi:UDP-N-acetylglucosamine transferase subunit ALG13